MKYTKKILISSWFLKISCIRVAMKIYLDYSSTTPLKKEVLKEMLPYLREGFGNASSIHSWGRETRQAIDGAREKVAKFLNCEPLEIIFTSGGTEANNLAIKGLVFSNKVLGNKALRLRSGQAISKSKSFLPHIITSAIEHHSVLDTCQWLEKMEFAEVSYLPVGKTGIVKIEDVKKALKKNTVLVSIMYANNEIGTVQPIREIGKMAEKINSKIKIQKSKSKFKIQNLKQIYFHTDAVQAPEYLNCNVKYLHVDMLTFSAHKFGGPKGVGILYVKKNLNLEPQNIGGAQEWGKRGGTENVAGIVGLGEAIELISKFKSQKSKVQLKTQKLRDKLIDGLLKKIPGVILNGDREKGVPHIINFCFEGIKSETLLVKLDLERIAASSGSACVSQSLEPSHVISALGISPKLARGCIRFSLGGQTTSREIDYVLKILPRIISHLRGEN